MGIRWYALARQNSKKKVAEKKVSNMNPRLPSEIVGIFLLAVGSVSVLSLLDLNTGWVGSYISRVLQYSFGLGAIIIPLLMMVIGGFYIKKTMVWCLVYVFGVPQHFFQQQ